METEGGHFNWGCDFPKWPREELQFLAHPYWLQLCSLEVDFTQNLFAPGTLCDLMVLTSWAVQAMSLGSGAS